MQRAQDAINADLTKLQQRMKRYEGLISVPEEREAYGKFKEKLSSYMLLHDKLVALSLAGNKDEAADLLTSDMRMVYDEMDTQADKFRDVNVSGRCHVVRLIPDKAFADELTQLRRSRLSNALLRECDECEWRRPSVSGAAGRKDF